MCNVFCALETQYHKKSISFIILVFAFGSVIHLKLVLILELRPIFFPYGYVIVPALFVESPFPYSVTLAPLSKIK